MRSRFPLLLVVLLSISASKASAQCAKDIEANLQNPCPLEDDITFPLPGNNTIAFRKVAVPQSAGKINARAIRLGSDNGNIFERPYEVVISGAFPDRKNKHWYYLLGKYEVSLGQYLSLEPGETLEERYRSFAQKVGPIYASAIVELSNEYLSQPVNGVTKYDAEGFLYRYNQWCQENKACRKLLPRVSQSASDPDSALGFFRLPSEIEWEYAARGGSTTLADELFRADLPFSEAEYANYAYVQDFAQSAALPIGSLNAIYGFHDMLGNVSEIVIDQFKPSSGHGHTGATTVRGGSFTTHISNLKLARRSERPVYREIEGKSEDERQSDTGFRIAIGAPALATPAIIDAMEGISNTYTEDEQEPTPTLAQADSIALQSIEGLKQALANLAQDSPQAVRAALQSAINLAEIKLHQSCVGYIQLASVFAELLSETTKNINRLREIKTRYADLVTAYAGEKNKRTRYEQQLSKTDDNLKADTLRLSLYGSKYRDQIINLQECGASYGTAALEEIETQQLGVNSDTNSIIISLIKRHFSSEANGDSWVDEVINEL